MNIISIEKRVNGSYPSIQTWDETYSVPANYAIWPSYISTEEFYNNGGFGELVVENGTVKSFKPNEELWNDYKSKNKTVNTQEIDKLKFQLSSTDYKVIKAYEYSLAGEQSPYNISQLHEERQAIRDKINALESGAT